MTCQLYVSLRCVPLKPKQFFDHLDWRISMSNDDPREPQGERIKFRFNYCGGLDFDKCTAPKILRSRG